MKRGIRQLITATLTAAVIISGWGINKLPAQAAEQYQFVQMSQEDIGSFPGSNAIPMNQNEANQIAAMIESQMPPDLSLGKYIIGYEEENYDLFLFFYNGSGGANRVGHEGFMLDRNGGYDRSTCFLLTKTGASGDTGDTGNTGNKDTVQNSDISQGTDAIQNDNASEGTQDAHAHDYSWITVQEADASQDGIEEYRCSCGDVQGRAVIPASQAFVKGLYGMVKDAPVNGSVTYDSQSLYTLSDYVIKKLAERTDVTTVITFTYQGASYKMTIPAGADYTALLSDTDYFYGYFYFAGAVGAVIEER